MKAKLLERLQNVGCVGDPTHTQQHRVEGVVVAAPWSADKLSVLLLKPQVGFQM